MPAAIATFALAAETHCNVLVVGTAAESAQDVPLLLLYRTVPPVPTAITVRPSLLLTAVSRLVDAGALADMSVQEEKDVKA